MRFVCSCLLALSLSNSGVLAADGAPLSAGQPAGLQSANLHSLGPAYILGGTVGVGILLAVFLTTGTAYVLPTSSAAAAAAVPVTTTTTTTVATTTTTG